MPKGKIDTIVVLVLLVFFGICMLLGLILGLKMILNLPEQPSAPEILERHYYYTENITDEKVEIVYVDRPIEVEKIVYVDRPVAVPQSLNRYFTDLAELNRWVKKDGTNELQYTGINKYAIDCDNFAYILQANADRDGFLMSVEHDELKNHEFNTVRIGNIVYGIEPQTDRIWKLRELD